MTSQIEFRVEWSDMDPAAMTFYPHFFKWFDWGTWHLLATAGLTYDVLRDEYGLIGCPVVEATSKFRSPARLGDRVQLTSLVLSWTRKTFCVGHSLHIGKRLIAEGKETRVCARVPAGQREALKAIIIPESLKAKLTALGA